MQIDRRQPRVIVDQPVILQPSNGSELHGRIRNLSQGGAYIVDLEQQPRVQSQVHIVFALPHGPDVEANATVLRSVPSGHPEEPEGIAVKFEDDDPGALAAFIREALGPGGEASNKVRLKLDTHGGVVITAREREREESGMVTVECDLPFLCIGSGVHLQRSDEDELHTGILSWVSAQTPPGSAYPRIHLGISLRTGREDPTPDLIPAKRGRRRQDPTEIVEPTMPHPLIGAPPKRPRLAWRWLVPTILGGLLVGAAIVVGVHYTTDREANAVKDKPPAPVQVAPVRVPETKPLDPSPEPLEPLEPPAPAPVAGPLAFATKDAADEDVAAARKRRTTLSRKRRARRNDLRRVRRADPRRLGIQRLLYRAKVSLRRGKLDHARRHLLRVLARDPSNEQAAELMRRVLRKKKKTPANT